MAVDAPAGLRLVPPERRHVTLRFLGDVDEAELRAVEERLRSAGLRRCTATVGTAASTFGRSILVVGVAGLDALAAAAGSDGRPFRGHVTLARGRDVRPWRGLPVPGGSWPVGEVTLVTSRLGRGGPTYEVVATVPLG